MNKIFDAFECHEDLFYAIYDYLCFVKPTKWNIIHSLNDFDYLLACEIEDLANDAIEWLKSLKDETMHMTYETEYKPTLYYMILAYMDDHKVVLTNRFVDISNEEKGNVIDKTIDWLRNLANNIIDLK